MAVIRKHPEQKAFPLKLATMQKASKAIAVRRRKPLRAEDICDAEDAALIHEVVKAAARDLAK